MQQQTKEASRTEHETVTGDAKLKAAQEAGRIVKDTVDADTAKLLSEIDEVLEANASDLDEVLNECDTLLERDAETFVKNFVQRGGQ